MISNHSDKTKYESLYSQVDKAKIHESMRQTNEANRSSPTAEINRQQLIFTYAPPVPLKRELSNASQSNYAERRAEAAMVSSGKAMEASVKKLAEYVMTNAAEINKAPNDHKIEDSDDEETDTENEIGQKASANTQSTSSGKKTTILIEFD